jgi:hypothetical protein
MTPPPQPLKDEAAYHCIPTRVWRLWGMSLAAEQVGSGRPVYQLPLVLRRPAMSPDQPSGSERPRCRGIACLRLAGLRNPGPKCAAARRAGVRTQRGGGCSARTAKTDRSASRSRSSRNRVNREGRVPRRPLAWGGKGAGAHGGSVQRFPSRANSVSGFRPMARRASRPASRRLRYIKKKRPRLRLGCCGMGGSRGRRTVVDMRIRPSATAH